MSQLIMLNSVNLIEVALVDCDHSRRLTITDLVERNLYGGRYGTSYKIVLFENVDDFLRGSTVFSVVMVTLSHENIKVLIDFNYQKLSSRSF